MTEAQTKTGVNLMALFIIIPTVIVVLAAIFILAGRREAPPMTLPPQKVILGQVETRDIVDRREYIAVVEADKIVDLRARVSGFLVAKNFEDGDEVKEGQLLFQIEPDQYQAILDNAEANVLSAQAQFDRSSLDFNRTTDLYIKKTSPKSDYDRAKADYEMAQAALMSAKAGQTEARLNLNYAAVKAPFDGAISDTPYSEGSLLSLESGVLATVVSVDPILVTFGISDKIITEQVKAGSTDGETIHDWHVRLRLAPDYEYPQAGRFTYVAPIVDSQTDTVKFKATFQNKDKILRPGQIVTAMVERINPVQKLVVPKEAVLTDAQGNYMLVPKEAPADPQAPGSKPGLVSEARRVTVDSTDALEKEYVIVDGLKEGDQFIAKGLMSMGATLRSGAQIVVETAEEAAAGQEPGAAAPENQPAGEEGSK